ncbi:hypothetical protein SAMN05216490_3243 [Mucilaginibacter mallensis]|uniref:Uncharacterized protein n=1 Tax=Mucilaginibacter mallensis TaxID=652787 RepID=A0A1H1ZUP5_MUCMA|nr:hypothetical protein SAMN05216490_3243 [Mucilaginibacter mallensis]
MKSNVNLKPEVTSMDFDRVSLDTNYRRGKFRVVFDINFTFGCENVKTEKEGQTGLIPIVQVHNWIFRDH